MAELVVVDLAVDLIPLVVVDLVVDLILLEGVDLAVVQEWVKVDLRLEQGILNTNQMVILVDLAVVIGRSIILIDLLQRRAVLLGSTGSHQDTVHRVIVDVSKTKAAGSEFLAQLFTWPDLNGCAGAKCLI